MKRELVLILACSGCVLNTNAPTEQPLLDDGAVRVAPLRLTLDDGVDTTVLEDLIFETPNPFDPEDDRLPFDYAGHRLSLEASQIANMVAVGGEVGLRVDGDYRVASLSRRAVPQPYHGGSVGTRTEVLEFDFSLDGRVVHATLELDATYHCPPFPTTPARVGRSGPPAVSSTPL